MVTISSDDEKHTYCFYPGPTYTHDCISGLCESFARRHFVTLEIQSTTFLQICEIQVYGKWNYRSKTLSSKINTASHVVVLILFGNHVFINFISIYLCTISHILHSNMKWLRYQRVISLKIQVGNTNLRNKWANTDPRIYRRWDQVPRRSTHPLLIDHTRREPSSMIMNAELSAVKISVPSTV
jgi:hypothetical protein